MREMVGSRTSAKTAPLGSRAFRSIVPLVLCLAVASCQPRSSVFRPPLEGEGQLFLYLQPPVQGSGRLAFRVQGASAVRSDGSRVPLSLNVREIDAEEGKRERLLAWGNLLPGQYQGLSLRMAEIPSKGVEGTAAPALADEGPITPFPFQVVRKKALVVSLKLRYRESVAGGPPVPSFDAEFPRKPSTGLIGIVSGARSNTVTMFDKTSGRVFAVVPTGVSPTGMVMNPPLRRAYVAVSGDDSVEVIDLLGAEMIQRAPLAVGDRPEDLALTPDRKTLLTANAGSNTVSVLEANSLIERKRIRVGNGPQSVIIDRAGRRAYVFNTLSNSISIIDLGAMEVAATISTEAGPVRGDFNRSGSRLYVLHRYSPNLNIYDTGTLSVLRRVYVGTGGMALKVDSLTDLIYLTRKGAGEISIYDPFSFLPIDIYRSGSDAAYLTIDGEENNLFAVFPEAGTVRMIRLIGKETVSELDAGEEPSRVTLMGER